ncbi:T9SS type A sorting domain-containing protein [Psychroserpens mesophilus]|uniref:T9SS type A sorting domain-containing protein n=1 Tax=Psychroserpens mesophilus TaxID=325473 RepID=UPI003D65F49E
MKNLLLIIAFIFISNATKGQSVNICNVLITEVSITGEVGFGGNGLDTTKACITISGTADICDDNGKVIGKGLTLTLESDGCNQNRMSDASSSPNELFLPLELLGEAPEFQGKEIPVVYPNPTNGIFTLKTKTLNLKESLTINSLTSGKKINAKISTTDKGYTVDLTDYPSGIYVLKYNKDGFEFSQKIIKK